MEKHGETWRNIVERWVPDCPFVFDPKPPPIGSGPIAQKSGLTFLAENTTKNSTAFGDSHCMTTST